MNKKHCQKELDELQRLKVKYNKLKEENSKLKKMISRMDLDRPDMKSYVQHSKKLQKKKEKNKKREEWKCFHCEEGFLKTFILSKANGDKSYFRKCSNLNCSHKTRIKKLKSKVEIVS